MADDFKVLLSTWVLSFVVTKDLEMRLAGEGEGREELQDQTRRGRSSRCDGWFFDDTLLGDSWRSTFLKAIAA